MELLPKGLTLELSEGCFPLSTDSMVLAHFVRLKANAQVLDLGSGCGTLGLLLCAKDPGCTVTGLEIDPPAHAAALENIQRNGLSHRLSSICTDLRTLPKEIWGKFDCCVSNPPYFSGGPASKLTPLARREDCCTVEELFSAAARALKYGGDFFLVHKPERLAELIACAARHGLAAKRLRLVRHQAGGSISLILLQLRKGGKPGLLWEELALYQQDGQVTSDYRTIYHMEG